MTIWLDLLGSEVRVIEGKKYRTRVIEAGRGGEKTLILLHGGGGHAETFARNVVRLGESFHTVAIDLLWHGFSSKPPFDDQYVLMFVDQLIDVMDDLGVSKASFEGLSFGGFIAMLFALNYPERVEKIVLNTTWGVRFQKGSIMERPESSKATIERSKSSVMEPDREKVRKRLELLFADPSQVTDELVEVRLKIYSDPETREALLKYYDYLWGEQTTPFLLSEDKVSTIRIPALVLWTDKNPGLGEDAGRRLAGLIPGASFHLIKGAAHWPQWEKPEEHDEAVRRFLIA
jgi:pimeloyl-ACP methyl ester carboxylesterase